MRAPEGTPVGTMRRVILSNIVSSNCLSKVASTISGIPGYKIEDVKISDVYLHHMGSGTAETAALVPQEKETAYPSSGMFGALPAHGFFIRHARNIELSNVEIASEKPEARPAFWVHDVDGLDLFRVKTPRTGTPKLFLLDSVQNFTVKAMRGLADTSIAQVDRKTIDLDPAATPLV